MKSVVAVGGARTIAGFNPPIVDYWIIAPTVWEGLVYLLLPLSFDAKLPYGSHQIPDRAKNNANA